MSEIKHVLTDVDGTLTYAAQEHVSERVHKTVVGVQEKGIKLTPVTGRPFEMAAALLRLLDFDGLGVFDGGASIRRTTNGELVWSKWLAPTQLQQLAEAVVPSSVLVDFYPGLKEVSREIALEDMRYINEPAPYVFAFVEDTKLPQVIDAIKQIPDVSFHVGPGRRSDFPACTDIQITHKAADKYHGVQALREIERSDVAHTLAIGDGSNDMPLFQHAGTKVAMGNAGEALKAAADYIVAPVEKDGFAEAMERFVLQ